MLINGEKWACETCIKGHRATHCMHKDRQLVLIKKKGRPSTQCKRCRELRIVRQLHVKCDCENQSGQVTKKISNLNNTYKKKAKFKELRPLAPKHSSGVSNRFSPLVIKDSTPKTNNDLSDSPLISTSCCKNKKSPPLLSSSSFASTVLPSNNTKDTSSTTSSCCSKKDPVRSESPFIEFVPFPDIPPPSSCCGPPSKNQQGEIIRVVTCRCGDSCACVGCDAHPSKAMKESTKDVYIGFSDTSYKNLSIPEILNNNSITTTVDHPSSILTYDSITLCGCGCYKSLDDCICCFNQLCNNPSDHFVNK